MRRKLLLLATTVAAVLLADYAAHAQTLRVPDHVTANAGATISAGGSGDATLYVFGPGTAIKRTVHLGGEIALQPQELRHAGRYTIVLDGGNGKQSATIFVTASQPAAIAFLARPSRVPVAQPGVITGVAFVFDDYKNLVLQPTKVNFSLAVEGASPMARSVEARDGIAWVKLDSARKQGAAQFVASVGSASVRRVVQQVASDPCDLRMRAQPTKNGILVETDPIRDCSGNAVPDGTIVTFTENDGRTHSTVDARIKRGVARAELPPAKNATLSVAAGVRLGNEIRWGGGE
jgi:hypothetical protein